MLDGKPKVGVDSEGSAGKGDDYDLQTQNTYHNDDKYFVPSNAFQNIQFFMQFSSVDEVEDLHHHKSIEDEGEMARICSEFQKDRFIVSSTRDGKETATPDSASHHSVRPLVLRMGGKDSAVEGIHILRNEGFATEDKDHHHDELEDSLTYDVLQHGARYDVLIAAMRRALEQFISRFLGSKGQRGKSVHNEIDPKHLNWLQDLLLQQSSPNECACHSNDIHCQLELHELANRVVDVSSPEDCLHD